MMLEVRDSQIQEASWCWWRLSRAPWKLGPRENTESDGFWSRTTQKNRNVNLHKLKGDLCRVYLFGDWYRFCWFWTFPQIQVWNDSDMILSFLISSCAKMVLPLQCWALTWCPISSQLQIATRSPRNGELYRGRNTAPVDRWFISYCYCSLGFNMFQPSKVVQDLFHPQYVGDIPLDSVPTVDSILCAEWHDPRSSAVNLRQNFLGTSSWSVSDENMALSEDGSKKNSSNSQLIIMFPRMAGATLRVCWIRPSH